VTAPGWAQSLVAAVCEDADVRPPRLLWRSRRAGPSTGVARRSAGTVSVRAGSDPLDQRLTLLHELAHWIAPAGRRRGRRTVHHGRAFYAVAFDLYRRHGLTDADALRLESARYRSALAHAAALGIPGAPAALAEHRSRLRGRPHRTWRVLVPEHAIRLERDGRWSVCGVCRQRVVGPNLRRVRRARRPLRHVLMTATLVT
jgi:hypothetical protein